LVASKAFAGTQAGVVGAFAGLECLGYQLFVGVIGFVLAEEDGGGEGFEEETEKFVGDSFGQGDRGKVSEPGEGGVPGGLGFCGWAGIVEGEDSEVVESGVVVGGVGGGGAI
jgi:hypothetical protein